jgi:hypothetical protein
MTGAAAERGNQRPVLNFLRWKRLVNSSVNFDAFDFLQVIMVRRRLISSDVGD